MKLNITLVVHLLILTLIDAKSNKLQNVRLNLQDSNFYNGPKYIGIGI